MGQPESKPENDKYPQGPENPEKWDPEDPMLETAVRNALLDFHDPQEEEERIAKHAEEHAAKHPDAQQFQARGHYMDDDGGSSLGRLHLGARLHGGASHLKLMNPNVPSDLEFKIIEEVDHFITGTPREQDSAKTDFWYVQMATCNIGPTSKDHILEMYRKGEITAKQRVFHPSFKEGWTTCEVVFPKKFGMKGKKKTKSGTPVNQDPREDGADADADADSPDRKSRARSRLKAAGSSSRLLRVSKLSKLKEDTFSFDPLKAMKDLMDNDESSGESEGGEDELENIAKKVGFTAEHLVNATMLYLNGKNLGDEDAHHVAQIITRNNNLHFLNLGDNNITDTGARLLAKHLKHDRYICHVYLYNNQIGNAGFNALCSVLNYNDVLCTLSVHGNQITDQGASNLARILRSERSKGSGTRLQKLKGEPTLRSIEMFDNNISDPVLADLVEAVKEARERYPLRVVFFDMGNL